MPPSDIATVMTQAVAEFAATSPVHLRHITVCIYQTPMVQQFADAVASKASGSSWTQQTVRGISTAPFSLLTAQQIMGHWVMGLFEFFSDCI